MPKTAPEKYSESAAKPTTIAKKVGQPPKPWWDDLVVEIARQILVGELKPDKQGDIERAMYDWIIANGHSAGATSIRERARKLFEALKNEDQNRVSTISAPLSPP